MARPPHARTARERTRPVAVNAHRRAHPVSCPHCAARFELFEADWCRCRDAPRSKRCARCGLCACTRPDYRDPRLWARAPPAFVREGFDRLFVAYL